MLLVIVIFYITVTFFNKWYTTIHVGKVSLSHDTLRLETLKQFTSDQQCQCEVPPPSPTPDSHYYIELIHVQSEQAKHKITYIQYNSVDFFRTCFPSLFVYADALPVTHVRRVSYLWVTYHVTWHVRKIGAIIQKSFVQFDHRIFASTRWILVYEKANRILAAFLRTEPDCKKLMVQPGGVINCLIDEFRPNHSGKPCFNMV